MRRDQEDLVALADSRDAIPLDFLDRAQHIAQTRFQATRRVFEARLDVRPPAAPSAARRRVQPCRGRRKRRAVGVIIEAMVARMGHQPLETIVAEPCRVRQRLCVTEAIDRARSNHRDAVVRLGLSVADLHLALLN